MKFRFLISLLSILFFTNLYSQNQEQNNFEDKSNLGIFSYSKDYNYGVDYYVDWNDDAEILGIGIGRDISKYGYLEFNLSKGFKFTKDITGTLGIGLVKRLMYNPLLIQFKIYPYIAASGGSKKIINPVTDKMESTGTKFDFTYGAIGKLEAGLKLFQTKKNNAVYFIAGYEIGTPEFDFNKDILKNGTWCFGLTIIH